MDETLSCSFLIIMLILGLVVLAYLFAKLFVLLAFTTVTVIVVMVIFATTSYFLEHSSGGDDDNRQPRI